MSGTAYTSYRGLPTVRVVAGLGTKAVSGGGVTFHKSENDLLINLWKQDSATAVTSNGLKEIVHHSPEIIDKIKTSIFKKFFEQLGQLHKQGNFYLEWASNENQIYIVQCAICEDRLPGNYDHDFDAKDYVLFLESTDVANSGRANCKTLIYVSDWKKETQIALEQLNKTNKDFVLIVPSLALSELVILLHQGKQLGLCHFSNALAVIEKQAQLDIRTAIFFGIPDHSGGRGASHFTQLCDRTDILYIGADFDARYLDEKKCERTGAIEVYQIETEIIVGKEGYVYIKK